MRLRIVEIPREYETTLDDGRPVELGRQADAAREGGPFTESVSGSGRRVVVAWNPENADYSARFVALELLPEGLVRVQNRSGSHPVPVAGGPPIPPGCRRDLRPPFRLLLKGREVWVGDVEGPRGPVAEHGSTIIALPPLMGGEVARLFQSLRHATEVVRVAVGSADFFRKAAEALVEIARVDSARVLLREAGGWPVAAAAGRTVGPWEPSRTILDHLIRDDRTVWYHRDLAPSAGSLGRYRSVVAAPVRDADGAIVGALYGQLAEEHDGVRPHGPSLREAEVELLIDLVAAGVSAGLARMTHEQQAARTKVVLGQFFPPALAARLSDGLPRGAATATVTVLFCDVRGFSAASGRLKGEPDRLGAWIRDVLTTLSACVLDRGGVLVDYVGDAIEAIWGAPEPQPDQTDRAVDAALAMLASLDGLNARWADAIGGPTGIGVGINRGEALVGDIGSEHKYKYGALGDTVNVASRIQALTKPLQCSLLVSRSVREALPADAPVRRVCQARMHNIAEPADVFEVRPATADSALLRATEDALTHLEAGRFAQACGAAGALLEKFPGDGPLRLILSRAAAALVTPAGFDPVWTPGK